MAKQHFFKRLASAFTILIYSTSALLADTSAAAGFYRPDMKVIASLYSKTATQVTQKQNVGVLAHVFGDEYIDSTDAAFLEKTIDPASMPTVTVENAVFVIKGLGHQPVKLQPIDLDKGVFKVNGFEFTWDETQSLEQNVERLAPMARAKGFSLNTIWDLVIPSAHAQVSDKTLNTGIVAAAAVIIVGIIALMMYKNNKNKLKVQEVEARLAAGQPAMNSVLNSNSNSNSSH